MPPKEHVRSWEDRNELAVRNDKLVFHILKRMGLAEWAERPGNEDLIQDMRMTLLRCLEEWLPEKGALSTYCCTGLWRCAERAYGRSRAQHKMSLVVDGKMGDEALAVEEEEIDPWEDLYGRLDTLPPREADIIRRSFGLRCQRVSQDALAAEYGVSRQRINQLQRKGLERLRGMLTA